ncbi:Guanine deaminase [Oopsacas minuta]|uniref:Guanine deaminase n=1 Tax=Oopsacas minuta TaxID=111878 RepID=A0AAV7K213_9METZ|nr:Guanine deaminase [Oopsacas minuta]
MQQVCSRVTRVFVGTLIHAPCLGEVIISQSILGIDPQGKILFIRPYNQLEAVKGEFEFKDTSIVQLSPSQFLIPGFIDTHIHAPQYPNTGLGLDKPLLEWLSAYTFPLEARFSDPNYARGVYNDVIRDTLRHGTTTACYFTSVHVEAAKVMCDLIHKWGQRGLVGKTCMDCNSPPSLSQTLETNIQGSKQLIAHISQLGSSLLSPVLTPRFALTCSEECMRALGVLAREGHYHIQTHISENKREVERAHELYPTADSYTHVYQECGLLTDKTILAHAIYLTDQELGICKEERVGIAHCPVSNFALKSGVFDSRRILERDIKLGLGTDVSGGYTVSMLEVMRQTLIASTCISFQTQDPAYRPLDYREAFHLATLGGARVLGLEDKVGSFEEGKEFDALLVDVNSLRSQIRADPGLSVSEKFQKFFFNGDDRNILEVFVSGRRVETQ